MLAVSGPTFNDVYYESVWHVLNKGVKVTPRNHECIEVRPATIEVVFPECGLYQGGSRRLNYRFWAIETLAYMAGMGLSYHGKEHAQLMVAANRNMAQFVNPSTHTFDGAYGPRLRKSLMSICRLLKEDPSSRQAYASIWQPGIPVGSLDVPCTLGMHFYSVSENHSHLGCTAMMRSNDLNWGTPYDIGAFCAVHCLMADWLHKTPISYTHYASSLHVYKEAPPTVVPIHEEHWNRDIMIPRLNKYIDYTGEVGKISKETMDLCMDFLMDLHSHRCVHERPWDEFDFSIIHPFDGWFKEWTHYIHNPGG